MEDKERIDQMLKDGKINAVQAELLREALKGSGKKNERILKQVVEKRQEREAKKWKYLRSWVMAVLVLMCSFTFVFLQIHEGSDTHKALKYFDEAGIALAEKDYIGAIALIKEGISKAEGLPVGYVLLGAIYQHLYEATKDESIKQRSIEAFHKADLLREKDTRRLRMNTAAIVFGMIFLIFIGGGVLLIFSLIYNHLIRNEEQANESLSQIRTMYQRKLDLIPALLQAGRAYLEHEQATLLQVTEARAKAVKYVDDLDIEHTKADELKNLGASHKDIIGSLGRLFAIAEQYPDLKADQHFLTVQVQLAETEGLIARERSLYNKRVRVFNSSIRYFPANIISGLFRFFPKEYYELNGETI